MADISGKRLKVNQDEQRSAWVEKYKKSNRHRMARWIFGKDYENWDLKQYLKENNIHQKEDEYPIWRRPIVKRISTSEMSLWGIRLERDEEGDVWTINNEEFVLEIASTCDILIMGKMVLLKSRFLTMRVGEMDFCEFDEDREFCSCFSKDSWQDHLRNMALEKLSLEYSFHEHVFLKFSQPSSSLKIIGS